MAEKSEKKSAKKKPAKKSTAKKGSSKKTTGKKKSTDLEARLEVPVKLEDEEKALDFYQKLRKKIKKQLKNRSSETKGKGAEYDKLVEALALLPDFFHLSVKLLFDKNVPPKTRAHWSRASPMSSVRSTLYPTLFLSRVGSTISSC